MALIDDASVRATLLDVLNGSGITSENIHRLGEAFTPPTEGPHLRTSLIWQRKKKTGHALTEAEGIWQVLVYAPEGTPAGAVEGLAYSIGALYEPYVDGPQLAPPADQYPDAAPFIRITEVATLTTIDAQDGDTMGGLRWVATPLQVDFAIELVPDSIV